MPRVNRPPRIAATSRANAVVTRDSRFSADFRAFLARTGFGAFAFAQADACGFGGQGDVPGPYQHRPVIAVHGNSGDASHFDATVKELLAAGYGQHEIYVVSWGPASVMQAANQTHSKKYLKELNAFFHAVIQYTGCGEVDVVSHSMGVTLSRGAILAGEGFSLDGSWDLGPSLGKHVRTFLGIAGGNLGLPACQLAPFVPTSNAVDGFAPGFGVPTPFGRVQVASSMYLDRLNDQAGQEAQRTVSFRSESDPISGGYVNHEPTAVVPGSEDHLFEGLGHMALKDKTTQEQVEVLQGGRPYLTRVQQMRAKNAAVKTRFHVPRIIEK